MNLSFCFLFCFRLIVPSRIVCDAGCFVIRTNYVRTHSNILSDVISIWCVNLFSYTKNSCKGKGQDSKRNCTQRGAITPISFIIPLIMRPDFFTNAWSEVETYRLSTDERINVHSNVLLTAQSVCSHRPVSLHLSYWTVFVLVRLG